MDLHPLRRRNLRPDRDAPLWAWLLGIPAYILCMGLILGSMGGGVTDPRSPDEMRARALWVAVPLAMGLIVLAIWTKRWARKPPVIAEERPVFVESDVDSSAWAGRVLDTKRHDNS